jgi:hypothetical protein
MSERVRISVSEPDLLPHYEVGWSYVMPDFSNRGKYVIEWRSDVLPVYPNRVPNNSSQESADGDGRRQST